jgi:ribosome biogenesis SPOUT family RNA methylase Rps3
MNQTYIIEHLEPELYEWCMIEYKEISKIIGKENLWFSNIKEKDKKKLEAYGKVLPQSIKRIKLNSACVLDPNSDIALTPDDAKKFKYFIFGGILGDYPPKQRTKAELTPFIKNAEARNIGKEQLSTDNAVLVTKLIANGAPLEKIKFQNGLDIKINEIESTHLPFRYPLINNKPHISQELVDYIKKDEAIS